VRRRIGGRPLIALALLFVVIVPTSSALAATPHQPSIGIRLVDVPADSGNDPRARSYIVDELAPGTTMRRRVEITNSTRSTVDVAVYPAAAGLSRGRFVFAAGHSQNEVSRWISVSRAVLRLPPGTKALDTLTIDVPEEASAGERYAVIWAEVSAPPTAGGVTLVNRVGVRAYLSIALGGALASDFRIGSLTAKRTAGRQPLVVAEIANTSRSTLALSGNLTLSKGPGGLRAGPYQVELGTGLAPGDSELVTVRLDRRLPRGPWRAQLRLRSGSTERTAVATLTFPRLEAPNAPSTSSRYSMLLALLVIALLALGVVCVSVLRARADGPRGS
jgi:hypothetical protein